MGESFNQKSQNSPNEFFLFFAPSPKARWKTGNQCWALTSKDQYGFKLQNGAWWKRKLWHFSSKTMSLFSHFFGVFTKHMSFFSLQSFKIWVTRLFVWKSIAARRSKWRTARKKNVPLHPCNCCAGCCVVFSQIAGKQLEGKASVFKPFVQHVPHKLTKTTPNVQNVFQINNNIFKSVQEKQQKWSFSVSPSSL